MPYYVCKGAKLKCSMGSDQSNLGVIHPIDPVLLCGEPMASIMDHKPMLNIMPFGQCQSLANPVVAAATAANYGRLQKMPCIPNTTTPWMPGKMNVTVKGQPALMDNSKCICTWAGVIEITDPGQKIVSDGEMGGSSPSSVTAGQSMGSSFGAVGSGSPSLSAAGTAVSTNAASSQITEAAASTGYQKTLIREVRGAADVFSRQDIEYWVAGYNKEQSEVSKADRNNVRWAVKVDSRRIELTDGRTGELIRGERIILGIPDEWAGKRILVMACLDGFNERVSQETKVGPISQGTLIRMVEGSEEVLPEREVKYKVTRYNKDLHLVSADFRNSVKWAVKVGEKEPEVLNKTGEELTLKIDKNWAGKTIVVMPHINKYTDIVSVRTRVGKIGNIRVKLGEKHYNAVSKLFEDANSSITAIFRKFEKKLFVNRIDVDVKDVEYDYINKELNLNIEADKEGLDKYGEKVFEPYERTIHEIWHKIDHLAGPSPNTFFSKAYMNELIEAFKADFRSIIGADISVFVTGDSNEIENNKYREFTEKNDFVLLNSIINAVTKGKLMYGHDEKYWNEKTIPAEIFANIAAIEIANPSASKAMQNQFSNTMKVYCEMICDMQKKEMI